MYKYRYTVGGGMGNGEGHINVLDFKTGDKLTEITGEELSKTICRTDVEKLIKSKLNV